MSQLRRETENVLTRWAKMRTRHLNSQRTLSIININHGNDLQQQLSLKRSLSPSVTKKNTQLAAADHRGRG